MLREANVSNALARTYEAGQSLIVRGVDLLMAETRLLLRDGRSFGIAVLVAVAGWLFLMHGLVDGLAERYPRFAVELAVGLAHVGAAALFVLRARSAPRRRERGR